MATLHIVFNTADIAVLQAAQVLDASLAGEIAEIKDDYAVGPLWHLDEAEGWQNRRDWWRMLLDQVAEYDTEGLMDMVNDRQTVHNIVRHLEAAPEHALWIWAAQNKHDVSGYYWLVSQLQAFQGRVFILYLNNLPFFNEKGQIFYPTWLWQIPPQEYVKARKLARPITPSEFEVDGDEWRRICNENKMVRLLEGGKKLLQYGEDYYDAAIDQYVGGDFVKGSRVLQQFLTKEKETTGDVFVLWRLKVLAQHKPYEVRGDISKSSKDFELRNPQKPALKKKAAESDTANQAEG